MDSNNVVIKYLGTLGLTLVQVIMVILNCGKSGMKTLYQNSMNIMTKMAIKESYIN